MYPAGGGMWKIVARLDRKFSQFTKRMEYLTAKKNTQQVTRNAAETLFSNFLLLK
jgi:uncharacterized small protein (DUF1192 family)